MTALHAAGVLGDTSAGHTKAELAAELEDVRDWLVESVLGGSARYALTIASGSITPPDGATGGGGVFTVETESSAASDDLTNIAQTNTHDGQLIILQCVNASHAVVVKHAAGGTGEIQLAESADVTLSVLDNWILLQRRSTVWKEIGRNIQIEGLASVTALTSSDLVQVWDDSASLTKSTPATQLGHVVQVVEGTPGVSHSNISVVIPHDDTIPQNTEGSELVSVSITPKATANRLIIEWSLWGSINTAGVAIAALFQDSTAGALAVAVDGGSAGDFVTLSGRHEMAAGTTSATTFKLRAGPSTAAANFYALGQSGGRQFGGVAAIRIRVTEYAA